MSVSHSARSGGIIGINFRFSLTRRRVVCFIRIASFGAINEYTQNTIFNIKKKTTLNYFKSLAKDFFQGTQEQV